MSVVDVSHRPEMLSRITDLPKADLHRRLEGSLRLGTLPEIADTMDLDLPGMIQSRQGMELYVRQ